MKKSLKNSFLLASALAVAGAVTGAQANGAPQHYEVINSTNLAYSVDLEVPGGRVALPYNIYSLLARNAEGQDIQCIGIRDTADAQTRQTIESLGYDLKVTDGDLYIMLQKQGMTAPEWPLDRGGCMTIESGSGGYSYATIGFMRDGAIKGTVQFELYTYQNYETEMKKADALINNGPQALSLRYNAIPCATNGYREDYATMQPGDRLTMPRICP